MEQRIWRLAGLHYFMRPDVKPDEDKKRHFGVYRARVAIRFGHVDILDRYQMSASPAYSRSSVTTGEAV